MKAGASRKDIAYIKANASEGAETLSKRLSIRVDVIKNFLPAEKKVVRKKAVKKTEVSDVHTDSDMQSGIEFGGSESDNES